MSEDNKKITIEVVRDSEDWLDFPPRLSVKEEGDKEPTIYGKSSRSTFDVAALEPKVFEVVNRYPIDEDAFSLEQRGEEHTPRSQVKDAL